MQPVGHECRAGCSRQKRRCNGAFFAVIATQSRSPGGGGGMAKSYRASSLLTLFPDFVGKWLPLHARSAGFLPKVDAHRSYLKRPKSTESIAIS